MPRITCLRTIRFGVRPYLIWLEVETDEGLAGLGAALQPGVKRRRAVVVRESRAG